MRKIVILALLLSGHCFAAIPNLSSRPLSIEEVRDILRSPKMDERMARLAPFKDASILHLQRLVQAKDETMAIRWRALTAHSKLQGKKAIPQLEESLRSTEWFIRSAALVSLAKLDPERAKISARRLLSDQALVVRLSAIDIIDQLRDETSAGLLWKKLDHPSSFRRKQSLSIRKRIVETLGQIEKKGSEQKFIDLLADHDTTLHAPAMDALHRITQVQIGTVKDDLTIRRAQWQQWWLSQSAKKSVGL